MTGVMQNLHCHRFGLRSLEEVLKGLKGDALLSLTASGQVSYISLCSSYLDICKPAWTLEMCGGLQLGMLRGDSSKVARN